MSRPKWTIHPCKVEGCPATTDRLRAYPARWDTRMCLEHSLADAVVREHTDAYREPHMAVDAALYSQWVQDVTSSRVLEYRTVRIPHMTQNHLSKLTGVSQTILSRLGSGRAQRVSRETAMALDPWMVTRAGPSQRDQVVDKRHVPTPDVAQRLPFRAIIVDRNGVAWQRMRTAWKCAQDDRNLAKSPMFPCRLLWLPPAKTPGTEK